MVDIVILLTELELVHNAAFTDPNDQSAWFYQRWLLGRSRQPLMITMACVSQAMACVALTQDVNWRDVKLVLQEENEDVPVEWTSSAGSQSSAVWVSFIMTKCKRIAVIKN